MSTLSTRTCDALNQALSLFGIIGDIEPVSDSDVRLSCETARQIRAEIAFVEGGSLVPFVNALMSGLNADGLLLRGDEGNHLARALQDIALSRIGV